MQQPKSQQLKVNETLPIKRIPDRLALFMPSLAGGGAERVMLTLAAEFVKRGLTVDLVLTRAQGAYVNNIPPGVRVVDLNVPRIIASLPGLVRYIRRERPSVILSALKVTNCIAVWARELASVKTRLVLCEHSTLSEATSHTDRRRERFLPCLMRWSYPRADTLIAVSKGVADDLANTIKYDRNKITVIYNPVVTPEIFSKAREPLNHPWFMPEEPPVVLGVGRLMAAKDFSMLIRAFARLRRSRRVRLIILGEGEERSRLEALVEELDLKEDVALPGFVDNPYNYMANASLFVLSSRWEGLPTVLIEAMACGTSVIATDCPSGPQEILESGKWGKLVPMGADTELAEAMDEILNNPSPDPNKRAMDFSVELATTHYLRLVLLTTKYTK